MISDERLDQLIRSSLEWQAERDARRAPSLAQSARRLAARLGPSASHIGPVVIGMPGSGRSVQLLLVALLMMGLLVAALLVGSTLLRPPAPRIDPGLLGFASACNASLRSGAVISVTGTGAPTRLYATGAWVSDQSSVGESRSSIVTGAAFGERRLTPQGIELVADRIEAAGLTAGCRTVTTQGSSGSIEAATADGVAHVTWGPLAGQTAVPGASPGDREARINELADALQRPETWLPTDVWVDTVERRVTPDRWLVIIGMLPTDYVPGDVLHLPDGYVVEGRDPRYGQLQLPGGQAPLDFGLEQPLPGRFGVGSRERCGVVDAADALALATSLDALELGADGYGDMFTEDLSWAIGFDLTPAYPDGFDCQALTDEFLAGQAPIPTTQPSGDLAEIDPCSLASPAVATLVGSTTQAVGLSNLPLGVSAAACILSGTLEGGFQARLATLTLYPWSTDRDGAETLANEALRHAATSLSVDGNPVWVNACLAENLQCTRLVATWSEGQFVVIELDYWYLPPERNLNLDEALLVVEAVLRALDGIAVP